MVIDDLAQVRISRHDDGAVTRTIRIGDRPRADLRDDNICCRVLRGDLISAQQLVVGPDAGRACGAVLHDQVHVAAVSRPRVDPVDQPGEGVVIGAHCHEDPGGHSVGPITTAPG